MSHIKSTHCLLPPCCCGTSKLSFVVSQTETLTSVDFMLGDIVSEIAFILEKRGRKSDCQIILCLAAHVRAPCGPIWKQTCMPNRKARASRKYISCSMHFCCLWFLSLSISVQLLVLPLMVRARTVHTQTISPLGRIDLMTKSTSHNR